MKKGLIILFGVILISFLLLNQVNGYMPPFTIKDCLRELHLVKEVVEEVDSCLRYAIPEKLEDCSLLSKNMTDYNEVLTRCYGYAMMFDSSSCEKLNLALEYKDKCYNYANVCSGISSNELKETCEKRVWNLKVDDTISWIKNTCFPFLYILILVAILFIIIKTIIDYIKKKKFKLWKRIVLVVLLIVLWFFVTIIGCFWPVTCYKFVL